MKLAKRTAAVLLIAWLRGAYGFIEPPTSSLMHLAERMCSFFKLMANIRVRVSRGSYGGNTPMPIYVYSNSPSAEKLKKKLPRDASWENLCRVSESVSATGFRNKLTVSQAYPDRFGQAVAELAHQGLSNRTMSKYGFDAFA